MKTFVDRARFAGTCGRAANWRRLGLFCGWARQPGPGWLHYGQPKEVLLYESQANARQTLRQAEEDPA